MHFTHMSIEVLHRSEIIEFQTKREYISFRFDNFLTKCLLFEEKKTLFKGYEELYFSTLS